MKRLDELLQEALHLPDPVVRSRRIEDRGPEMDLIAHIVSKEQIALWAAKGVKIERGINVSADREVATLLFAIVNGHRNLLKVTYNKRNHTSLLDVEVYGGNKKGESYKRPVTLIADLSTVLTQEVEKMMPVPS